FVEVEYSYTIPQRVVEERVAPIACYRRETDPLRGRAADYVRLIYAVLPPPYTPMLRSRGLRDVPRHAVRHHQSIAPVYRRPRGPALRERSCGWHVPPTAPVHPEGV